MGWVFCCKRCVLEAWGVSLLDGTCSSEKGRVIQEGGMSLCKGLALWEGACPGERDRVIRGSVSLWEGFFPEEGGVSL